MKKLTLRWLLGVSFMFGLASCSTKGESTQYLNGTETNLPPELQGLKVYDVAINDGGTWIKVALLPGYISTPVTYQSGKQHITTIVLQKANEQRTILAKEIISENDSIIVLKK